jgi:aldehyde:ferredoxin oxidoreductase
VTRKDDTLPDRWFDEPNRHGAYKGEHIDRAEFDALLSRFYRISNLTDEGIPIDSWRRELEATMGG